MRKLVVGKAVLTTRKVCVQTTVSSTALSSGQKALCKDRFLSTFYTRLLPIFSWFPKVSFVSFKSTFLPIINRTYKDNYKVYINNSLLIMEVS